MNKAKEADGAESQTADEIVPLFCSEACDKAFATKVQFKVDNTNESSMHLLGGTPTAPFSKLKNAGRILSEYSCSMQTEDVFARIEKRNIDKLLDAFWKVMAPYDDVKIVEKNTELLEPATNQEEENKQELTSEEKFIETREDEETKEEI